MLEAKLVRTQDKPVDIYNDTSFNDKPTQKTRIMKVKCPFLPSLPPRAKGKRKSGNAKESGSKKEDNKPLFNLSLGALEVPKYFTAHDIEWMADMPLYNVNGYKNHCNWYMKTNLEGTILHDGCN